MTAHVNQILISIRKKKVSIYPDIQQKPEMLCRECIYANISPVVNPVGFIDVRRTCG